MRAKMVQGPGEWAWSSYLATSGFATAPPFLATRWILGQFAQDEQAARQRYAEFVAQGTGRSSPLEGAHGGLILGTEAFVKKMRALLDPRRSEPEFPQVQRLVDRPPLAALLTPATSTDRALRDRGIGKAVLDHGYRLAEVGRFLGLHYATVSRIAKIQEGLRSAPPSSRA